MLRMRVLRSIRSTARLLRRHRAELRERAHASCHASRCALTPSGMWHEACAWGAALGPMPTQEAQPMRDRKADNLVRKQLRLEQCAWANRRVMTGPALRLWSALSARRLSVQFRREVPLLGLYIVDFCAPGVRPVVEVDGECHADRRATDVRRDAALRSAGYRTLRLEAQLVMQSLSRAVALVRAAL